MVVLIKYYEMDNEGPRTKKGGLFRRMFWGSSWSIPANDPRRQPVNSALPPPRERRPLRSVPSAGPQFKVDPEVLVKEYVEKEIKFLGTVDDAKQDFDASNRNMVLSLIDEKRKVGLLPWHLTYKNDVVLSFSVQNIKISWRDGEQLIHRIPTHKVAAAGYVQDDRDTFLFIKFASELNSEMCNIAIFACESRTVAQEMCSLTQQLFRLVYTESTMDFFDKAIQDGANTPKHHSYSTDDSDKRNTIRVNSSATQDRITADEATSQCAALNNGGSVPVEAKYASNSSHVHNSAPSSIHRRDATPLMRSNSNGNGVSSPMSSSTPSSPANVRRPRRSESSSGSYSHVSSHQIQLKEYIAVLKERLTSEELNQFAQHLHHFRTGGIPIEKFCDHLMSIYKEPRKSLLLGMRHFIPDANDRSYFETFLAKHDVTTFSGERKRWWDRTPDSRTTSETEESSAQSAALHSEHFTEISSNSGHTSPHSHNDSDEWETMRGSVQRMNLSDTENSSTLKPTQQLWQQPDQSTTSRGVVIGTEDGDSPVLRSGDMLQPPRSPTPVYVPRSENTFEKRKIKKFRSKSPSPAELGAPYPSFAVTGTTDDDVDDRNVGIKKQKKKSREKKPESEVKDLKKRKKLKKSDQQKLKAEVAASLKAPDDDDDGTGDAPSKPSSSAGLVGNAPATTTPLNHRKPPEHRKKKRHKHEDVGVVTEL